MSDTALSTDARLRRISSWTRLFAVAAIACVVAVSLLAAHFGRTSALDGVRVQARTDTTLKIALLQAVLERSRILPQVLARDPELRQALKMLAPDDLDAINTKFERLVEETRVSVIYAVKMNGFAVAASNWRQPDSFIENHYSFRAYFTDAVGGGVGEHFALGTVSLRPGLYVSRRVDDTDGTPLGVIVVKIEFDQLERDWASSGNLTFITDDNGVVLITSRPELRFRSVTALTEEQRRVLRESLQFGEASLDQLTLRTQRDLDNGERLIVGTAPAVSSSSAYLDLQMPVETTSWTINYLAPVSNAMAKGMREWMLLALAGLLPVLAAIGLYLRKRRVADLRLIEELQARDRLERRVEERTSDLRAAHGRLEAEMAEHYQTEQKLQAVQQELVSANRLAILGQVVAGVAHEVNQPLATIRSYADNARSFLDMGRTKDADENLVSIGSLTQRIARITQELRNFARKGKGADKAETIAVRDIVEGALMLLRSRFRTRMEALDIDWPSQSLTVTGSRIRLEQVMINLLQNAFEAIGESNDGRVAVVCHVEDTSVRIVVHDNGAGLSPEIRAGLFTPFNTSKEQGLGLGLVISRDIVAEHGGTLTLESDEHGTRATITLEKA